MPPVEAWKSGGVRMTSNVEGKSAKILVVDDNAANRDLARSTLEDEGYEVVLATGGAEGVAKVETEHPDCVLLDVRMPDMDGFAACERIRALPAGADTPVLFFTALRDVDTFDHALRAGGDDFLTKPVRPTELVVRVQAALNLRRVRVELREHYALLKQQRDALLRLQLQKERLTAFVVHDLKNPVNAMDLHAQLLLRDKSLPPSAHEAAAHIRRDARHLTRMIMNLLDLAKADEGKLSSTRTDMNLHALVEDVVGELGLNAAGRRVSLETALETDRIYADEALLRRTVTNLVENALRYAPPGSSVRVTSRRTPEWTEVRIADAGRGIAPDMRAKIFEPFVQLESSDAAIARGGRGLGLAFCKQATEVQGGEISVEDGAPGAVFCVRLPNGP
jgi:two-component system sensor histidine kinase/response regulator